MTNFSQNDEQRHILAALADEPNRLFIDIGAHDGRTFSNTRALALAGWSGVLVDPAPWATHKLLDLYGSDDRMTIIQAALTTDGAAMVKFWDCGPGLLGTIHESHTRIHAREAALSGGFRRMLVPALGWGALLDLTGEPPSFISLDVEGHNLATIRAAPWERLGSVRVLCIEKDSAQERDITARAVEGYGFTIMYESAENIVGVRQ